MNIKNETAIQSVLKAVESHDQFIVLGHEDPDADSLGSQIVLSSWLKRRGKKVYMCSSGSWKRPEIRDWESLFEKNMPSIIQNDSLLYIIVDCSSMSRTDYPNALGKESHTCVIDHHAVGTDFGDIRYIDADSPSNTLLIQNIIEYAGDSITEEEAKILFLGFCTDTGYFRHLEPGSSSALESVARLIAIGASPTETFRMLSGGRSLQSRNLLGRVLERSKAYFDGRLVLTYETLRDNKELGNQRDSDMLYQLITSISGVQVAIIIREQSRNKCIVGLRSINDIDVGAIARRFDGGGHRKAAGCTIEEPLEQVIDQILELLEKSFNKNGGK